MINNDYKTCLNKQGYILRKSKFDEKTINNIKKELTVCPNYCPDFQEKPLPFKLYKENKNKLYLPRYYGLLNFNTPDIIKFNDAKNLDNSLIFAKELRQNQLEIIDKYLEAKDKVGGGIIAAGCGIGKTVISIYLISQIKLKTLILVHKEFLMHQWIERINEFLPNANIGIIQGTKYDVVNKDIVIGMIQTVSTKTDYPDYVFRDFGFLVADECHHLGARSFSQALKKTNFKYTLGLSATPNRKDGLSKVFKYFLGDIIYKSKVNKDSEVLVHVYKYINNDSNYNRIVLNVKQKMNNPAIITNIIKCEKRNLFIYSLLKSLLDEDRNILILSARVAHVDWFISKIEENNLCTVGKYTGNQKNLDKSLDAKIIIGTYAMIAEGFDCKKLDTLIMTTPQSDIAQIVGRIMRKKKEERTNIPLIIDIWDQFANFNKKGLLRLKYYKTHEYNKIIYEVNDDSNTALITKLNIESDENKQKKNIIYKFSDE